MRSYTLYIWIGVWLFILPFLGIPGSWKETLTALTAMFVVGHALLAYRRSNATEEADALPEEAEEDTYTENSPSSI